ncbi:tyrosine-type recombinase/integrase [Prevotella pallens]
MCSFCIREISNKPSIIYLVCSDSEGKYYKISTGRKILYSQWNKRKQEPIISSMFSNDVNRSALVTCHVLNKLKSEYQNYIYYLCSNNEKFNINILRAKINSIVTPSTVPSPNELCSRDYSKLSEQIINFKVTDKMVKGNIGKTPSATKALDKALKQYIADSQVKESTGKNYRLLVGKYKRWVVDVYKVDSMSALKQSAFDKYIEYLKKEGASSNEINKLVVIKKLINNYIAKGNKYGLTQIIFNPLKDKRLSDDRVKVELLDNEIEKLENIALPAEYQLYRDLFMLAIYTGQRVSDIQNIAVGVYERKGDFLVIKTIKRGKAAYIPLSKKVEYYLSKVEGKVKPMSGVNFRNKLNNNIKEIFKMAGIDRMITYKDAHQKTITAPLYSIISSHFARHTFITRRVREGYSYEEVGKMVGDTGRVVERTYSHLTADDHIKTLKDKAQKLKADNNEVQVVKKVEAKQSSLHQVSSLSKGTVNLDDIIDTLKDMQGGNISVALQYLKQNKVKMIKLIEYYTGKKKGMIVSDDAFTSYLMTLWERLKYEKLA